MVTIRTFIVVGSTRPPLEASVLLRGRASDLLTVVTIGKARSVSPSRGWRTVQARDGRCPYLPDP